MHSDIVAQVAGLTKQKKCRSENIAAFISLVVKRT
jgi:hypothetical protein